MHTIQRQFEPVDIFTRCVFVFVCVCLCVCGNELREVERDGEMERQRESKTGD
jgi:hypothetical protein